MNAPSLATGSSAASTIRWLVGTSPDAPTDSEWVDVLPLVRRLGLGGRLASRVRDTQLVVHPTVRDHLEAAGRIAAKHETSLRWETQRVSVALSGLDVPVILLKGAAYQARGLPAAIGRYSSDIDIMVPRERLEDLPCHRRLDTPRLGDDTRFDATRSHHDPHHHDDAQASPGGCAVS